MNDDLIDEITVTRGSSSIIAVLGVGGAGGNAVNHMYEMGIKDVDFIVCNTDRQALALSPVEYKLQLGAEGLGAGNDPEMGRRAAIESIEDVRSRLDALGTRMVFITAGMGGGTGTGASPVIAKLAKEMGLLTVAIITSPLKVEGRIRYNQAHKGIDELKKSVDSLLILNNENILKLYDNLPLTSAFSKADDILCSAVKGISEIITVEGAINVDFADVSKVMSNSGRAHMSVSSATGEGRAEKVATNSLISPLLEHTLITGASNILINIATQTKDKLISSEVITILNYVQEHASYMDEEGNYHDANIIWGTSEKPTLGDDEIELVVVATGFSMDDATVPLNLLVNKEESESPEAKDEVVEKPQQAEEHVLEVEPQKPIDKIEIDNTLTEQQVEKQRAHAFGGEDLQVEVIEEKPEPEIVEKPVEHVKPIQPVQPVQPVQPKVKPIEQPEVKRQAARSSVPPITPIQTTALRRDVFNPQPAAPSQAAPQNSGFVVLGQQASKYGDIEQRLNTPAFVTRNSRLVADTPRGHKEVLLNSSDEENFSLDDNSLF